MSRKLKLAAQIQQNAVELLVGSLLKELAFLMQNKMLCSVYKLLYVDSFFIEILQLSYLDLIRRLMLESIFYAGLQIHDITYGGTRYFLECYLDVAYIASPSVGNALLLIIIHQLMQILYVFVDDSGIDFFVGFEQ